MERLSYFSRLPLKFISTILLFWLRSRRLRWLYYKHAKDSFGLFDSSSYASWLYSSRSQQSSLLPVKLIDFNRFLVKHNVFNRVHLVRSMLVSWLFYKYNLFSSGYFPSWITFSFLRPKSSYYIFSSIGLAPLLLVYLVFVQAFYANDLRLSFVVEELKLFLFDLFPLIALLFFCLLAWDYFFISSRFMSQLIIFTLIKNLKLLVKFDHKPHYSHRTLISYNYQ